MTQKILILAALLVGLQSVVAAEEQGSKKTFLQEADFPGNSMKTILVTVKLDPLFAGHWHTHPGIEMLYIAEGAIDLTIKGQPQLHLKKGDSAINPAGVPHQGTAGPEGALVIATYVVDKTKPLVVNADQ